MNIGKAAVYFGKIAGIGSLITIVSYIGACNANNFIADRQSGIHGTIEVSGRLFDYDGVKPYINQLSGQSSKGHLDVSFKDDNSKKIMDADLTVPGLSLDDVIAITLPSGKKVKFNFYGDFDDKDKRHDFIDGSQVKQNFQREFLDAQGLYHEVEKALEEAAILNR